MEKIQGTNPATADLLEGRWKQLRGELRSWWGRLTEDDLEQVGGQQDKLIGRLQERYGYTRERAQQDVERRLQEYHARIGTFSPRTTPPTGASSPSGMIPSSGTSAPKVGSSPAREQAAEPSPPASSAANQATSAVGEQLGSLAGMIRDKAPREGTAGQAATAVAEKLGAAGAYLQEKKVEHVAGDLTDLDRAGAISPFIWWHNGDCGGLEEIWSVNQGLAGVQVKPFFRFWVALTREQARLLQQLGGV